MGVRSLSIFHNSSPHTRKKIFFPIPLMLQEMCMQWLLLEHAQHFINYNTSYYVSQFMKEKMKKIYIWFIIWILLLNIFPIVVLMPQFEFWVKSYNIDMLKFSTHLLLHKSLYHLLRNFSTQFKIMGWRMSYTPQYISNDYSFSQFRPLSWNLWSEKV
jgi:hypothetical protein